MQNRYVCDIGDYSKYALLRRLMPFGKLGVAWWLTRDESHNDDGKHRSYLDKPNIWRSLDADLFDLMVRIRNEERFDVRAIEQSGILGAASFFSDYLDEERFPAGERSQARSNWFAKLQAALSDCDIVFADPDNGFAPGAMTKSHAKAHKSIFLDETQSLMHGRKCVIVYHHQTRRPGGHDSEIQHWLNTLRSHGVPVAGAIRCSAYSPRAYFICTESSSIVQAASQFAANWRQAYWKPASEG
jgi:hypothetical protein